MLQLLELLTETLRLQQQDLQWHPSARHVMATSWARGSCGWMSVFFSLELDPTLVHSLVYCVLLCFVYLKYMNSLHFFSFNVIFLRSIHFLSSICSFCVSLPFMSSFGIFPYQTPCLVKRQLRLLPALTLSVVTFLVLPRVAFVAPPQRGARKNQPVSCEGCDYT